MVVIDSHLIVIDSNFGLGAGRWRGSMTARAYVLGGAGPGLEGGEKVGERERERERAGYEPLR